MSIKIRFIFTNIQRKYADFGVLFVQAKRYAITGGHSPALLVSTLSKQSKKCYKKLPARGPAVC